MEDVDDSIFVKKFPKSLYKEIKNILYDVLKPGKERT